MYDYNWFYMTFPLEWNWPVTKFAVFFKLNEIYMDVTTKSSGMKLGLGNLL